jgi:hypothetical protein
MSEGQPIGNELTSEHGLEGVAKGLAQGTVSRRKALGALGGILGGGLLAALIPGRASAQIIADGPGRSEIPKCCREALERFQEGVPGAEYPYLQPGAGQGIGRCVSDRARLLDCDDCPETCAEEPPNGGGGNGQCDRYTKRRVCVPRCPEGFRINVATTGTGETTTTTVTCVPVAAPTV